MTPDEKRELEADGENAVLGLIEQAEGYARLLAPRDRLRELTEYEVENYTRRLLAQAIRKLGGDDVTAMLADATHQAASNAHKLDPFEAPIRTRAALLHLVAGLFYKMKGDKHVTEIMRLTAEIDLAGAFDYETFAELHTKRRDIAGDLFGKDDEAAYDYRQRAEG